MKNSDWRVPRIAVAILTMIVLLLATVGSSAASPKNDPDEGNSGQGRVGICHETGNGSIYIEVSESAWLHGHSKHGDKLASGPGDCERNGSSEAPASATGTSVTSATISVNPASPQNIGTSVTLTAASTPNISTEYRWWMLAPNSSNWADMSGWGGNSFTWNTAGLAAGTYQISVWARATGSSSDVGYYQVNPMIYYTLTVPATVQPTAQPTAQPTVQPTVQPTAQTATSDTVSNGRSNGRGHNR